MKFRVIGIVAALAVAMPLTLADTASAAKAKKLTYDQAWIACKKFVAAALPGDTAQSAARYTRGAACMKKYGHRL